MRRVLTTIWVLLHMFLCVAQGQSSVTITGKVMDSETKEPLEYTTIQLLQLPDSSLATGSTSNLDGSFELKNVKAGNFIVRVSFVGYVTLDRKVKVTEEKPNVDLGVLRLKPDSEVLSAVTVTGKVTPVVMKEDTIEFNSSAFRVADGAMLEDLVKKLPGAEISPEGKLTVNGKEIKKILVDGKEFFSNDPKVSLKNLPANMVDKVKTYNKKSDNATMTGVDDDDDEAVLDLSVKKGMKNGWFGNVLGGLGTKERYEAGGIMNRFSDDSNFSVLATANNTNNSGFSEFGDTDFGRLGAAGSGITSSQLYGSTFAKNYKKTEFGGNVQFGHSDNDSRVKSSTETFLGKESSYRNDTTISERKRNDLSTNFRLKWTPDSSNTFLILPNLTYSKTDAFSDGLSETRNGERDLVNRKRSSTINEGDNLGFNTSLRYYHKFKKKGRSLSTLIRIEYTGNESESQSNWQTNLFMEDSLFATNRETDREGKRFTGTGEISYTEPVSKRHSLFAKFGVQERLARNDAYVYDLNLDPSNYVDSLSSEVKNNYIRYTAEVGLQGKYDKATYNFGAAIHPQTTTSETNVGPNAGKKLSQNVVNFSPSIRFRYKFSKKSSISFNYRGQSSAPNIEYLQNIISQEDPLNIQYGDPDLKPSFTNNLRLRFNDYNAEKQTSFMANLGYSNTLNSVTNRMIYNEKTGGRETYKVNVDGNWNANALVTATFPILYRKINVSNSCNGNYSERVSYASVAGNKEDQKTYTSQECTTQSLSLSDKLMLNYRLESFDLSANASVAYQSAYNRIQKNSNRETYNYSFGGNANIYLPWNFSISTDANYDLYSGYTDGYGDPTFIWNAQISKNFLKNNAATVRVKVYDILQQQTNLTRSVSNTEISDTEYNTLGSYIMFHFVYRINTLGKKAGSGLSGRGGPNGYGGAGGPREGAMPPSGDRPPRPF